MQYYAAHLRSAPRRKHVLSVSRCMLFIIRADVRHRYDMVGRPKQKERSWETRTNGQDPADMTTLQWPCWKAQGNLRRLLMAHEPCKVSALGICKA